VQSIYNRFGSFEALLDDLANRGFRDLGQQILDLELAPLPDAGDPLATLVEALNRYRTWALDRPELHRFMFEADLSTRTRQTADRTVGIIVAAAGNGARAGLLLPEPAPLLANRLLAALHGSLQLELTGWTTDTPPPGVTTGPGDNVATMLRGLTPTAQLR
jgi:AcrR family transcriptional regulator